VAEEASGGLCKPERGHREFLVAIDQAACPQFADVASIDRAPLTTCLVKAEGLVAFNVAVGSQQLAAQHGFQDILLRLA
jgi:hypothetical protein